MTSIIDGTRQGSSAGVVRKDLFFCRKEIPLNVVPCKYFRYPPDIIFLNPSIIGETFSSIGDVFRLEQIQSLCDSWESTRDLSVSIDSVITELESILVKRGLAKIRQLSQDSWVHERAKLDFDFVKGRKDVEILVLETPNRTNGLSIHMLIPIWEISEQNGPPCIVGNDRFEVFATLRLNEMGEVTDTTLEFKVPTLLPLTNASYKLAPYNINHDCLATYIPKCIEGFRSTWCKRRDFLNKIAEFYKFTLEHDTIDQSFRSFLVESRASPKRFQSAVVTFQMTPSSLEASPPRITIRTFSWCKNMKLINVPQRYSPTWSLDSAARFYTNQVQGILANDSQI